MNSTATSTHRSREGRDGLWQLACSQVELGIEGSLVCVSHRLLAPSLRMVTSISFLVILYLLKSVV